MSLKTCIQDTTNNHKNRTKKKSKRNLMRINLDLGKELVPTRKAILVLRILTERRLNININKFIIITFHLEKAFDTINWDLLMNSMKKTLNRY